MLETTPKPRIADKCPACGGERSLGMASRQMLCVGASECIVALLKEIKCQEQPGA